MKKIIAVGAMALGSLNLLLSGSPARADSIYATITGAKQGLFIGDGGTGANGKVKIIGYNYSFRSPRDAASGLATGKILHSPVVITKEWGPSTPQLSLAASTAELLKSVLLTFTRSNASGTEEVYYTVKLTNASIAAVTQYRDGAPGKVCAAAACRQFEDITLVFGKIEQNSTVGGTASADDWTTAN